MPLFKEKSWKEFKPLDLNLTLLIKYASDWSALLRKLSPLSSIIFILLNFRSFITDKRAIITAALFLPALAITPSSDILRFILSVFVLWIFLKKFDKPYTIYAPLVALIICLYTLFVFGGIFFPQNYLLSDHSFRYKFVFETHNALTVYGLFSFTYLLNYFLEAPKLKPVKWLNIFVFITILLWIIIFLMIKSRLYLTISFLMMVILAYKNFRQSRTFALLPVCYIIAFVGVSKVSQLVIRPGSQQAAIPGISTPAADSAGSVPADTNKTVALVNTHKQGRANAGTVTGTVSTSSQRVGEKENLDSIREQEALKLVDNKRVFSFSGTGREKMVALFFDLYKDLGWKQFIYQNHTKVYLERKSKLPNINIYASTLTENSYLIILLSTGYIGLIVFLYIFGVYCIYFIRQRTWLSLLFLCFLMAVWYYEETITYPFSMIAQLFALATIHRFERKNYESSHHH